HFARTGVLTARGTVDQQNGRPAAIGMPALRIGNRRAGGQPILRELVARIGEFAAGFARPRRFTAVLVVLPRHRRDPVELASKRFKGGVAKLVKEAPAELVL